MARAVSSAEVTPREIIGTAGNRVTVTDFFGNLHDPHAAPQAFLVRYDRDGTIRPHFHKVDQYQVVVEGGGTLGKHSLSPVVVHYTDGFTPYGPIHAGAEGLSFFTLRVRPDVGAYFMPGSGDRMERKAGRTFSVRVEANGHGGDATETLRAPDASGLGAFRLRLAPGASATGPSPRESGGQYYVVAGGAVTCEGRPLPRLSLVHVAPGDAAPRVTAGPEGADVLVLQYPRG